MKSKLLPAITLPFAVCALMFAGQARAASVTGNPFVDGWTNGGNSLDNGVYVRGSANYGFDIYSMATTLTAGSNLLIADGANSWVPGDTVLGIGGSFDDITALDAGWPTFTGNTVNQLLGPTGSGDDLKLQVKFGATDSTFGPSTLAPGAGNGLGSLGSNGGNGAVQLRTSAYFDPAAWAAGSGQLMLLDKPEHITRNGIAAPDADVARIVWNWDASIGRVTSWEILLNVNLLDRLQPTLAGTIATGGLGLATVQNRDGAYTDGLAGIPFLAPVTLPPPDPVSMSLVGLGLVGLVRRARRKRTSA